MSWDGERKKALATVLETVEIRRELAREQPDAHRPRPADSLHNLSNDLGNLRRQEEPMAAALEASEIRQGLAQAWPDAHQDDIAQPLRLLPWLQRNTCGQQSHEPRPGIRPLLDAATAYRALHGAPPPLMFLFFNRQIVAGITSGAIKG
ncbi:hypothetical protein [Streptomyces mirabilis]|uniref:hypothetical protein n=1 Tax=Streptomyces mirabilis TaxID=68239 RepID=UPI0033BCEFAF